MRTMRLANSTHPLTPALGSSTLICGILRLEMAKFVPRMNVGPSLSARPAPPGS